MPTKFDGYAVLKGADDRTQRMIFHMGTFTDISAGAEFLLAKSALDDITGALEAVTDAELIQTGVVEVGAVASTAGAGDLFEKALVNVWAINEEDPEDVEAKAQIYIPAPTIGIFQTATGPGRNRVDVSDAALQQYVQQLAQHALISDGETIQEGSGVAGMDSGRRVVRKFTAE